MVMDDKLKYLRRLPIIKKLIERSLLEFEGWNSSGITVDKIINFLSVDVPELYFFSLPAEIEVSDEDYEELSDFIKKYIDIKLRKTIHNMLMKKRGEYEIHYNRK